MAAYDSPWIKGRDSQYAQYQEFGGPTPQQEQFEAQQAKALAMPETLANRADPYAAKRDQLINDPAAALENNPFFKYLQEKYIASVTASNAAKGLRNSGRGMMAIGEAGQKAASGFYFPYLQSLGRPETGTNTYLSALRLQNTPVSGGGSLRMGGQQTAPSYAGASAGAGVRQPATQPQAGGALPYSSGLPDPRSMTTAQLMAESGLGGSSAGAGTGYVVSDQGTTQFMPDQYGGQASTYQSANPSQQYADYGGYSDYGSETDYGGYS